MMYKVSRNQDKVSKLVFLWVALWSFNFLGLGTKIALFGGVIILAKLLFERRKFPITFVVTGFQIIAFGIIYTALINYYDDYSILRGSREMFLPTTLYMIAFLSINRKSDYNNSKFFIKTFMIMAICLFLYASANLFTHLWEYGQFAYYNRRMYDIWTGELTAATTQGSRFILMSAMFPTLFFYSKNYSKLGKLILSLFVLITIIATLIMANRTLLVILLINFLISLTIFLKLNRFKSNIVIKVFSLIMVAFIVMSIIYASDMFGVQTFYKNSNFYARLQVLEGNSITESSRTKTWETTIIGLFQYPMGGSKSPILLSAPHNLWLDVAYTSGFIPFILLISITISYLRYYLKLMRTKYLNNHFKIFLTSITISLFLNSMVEPILGGHYFLFMIFIFQLGLMQGLYLFIKKD